MIRLSWPHTLCEDSHSTAAESPRRLFRCFTSRAVCFAPASKHASRLVHSSPPCLSASATAAAATGNRCRVDQVLSLEPAIHADLDLPFT